MKRQDTPAAEEPVKKKRRRRATDPKTGLTVFEPNTVYFNDYLETYIGAKWQAIKNSLYDAGYQRKAIEAALAEMGITNETQLNDAIRNMKPLNLSLMAERQQERKAS